MKQIISVLAALVFTGCFTVTNVNKFNSPDEFSGTWKIVNNSSAVLRIIPARRQTYTLKFNSGEYQWEGVGFKEGDEMVAIFRYRNISDYGYVTFHLDNHNKLSFISRNPDGGFRSSSYYIRY